MKVLDLFCGAGGLSLGFQEAGYDIIGGIDFDKDAIETHDYNFKKSKSYCLDICTINNEEINNSFNNVDVIIGGPPCQGFSTANMWQKDEEDERNKLFFEFIRFVEVVQPQAILIENVQGILTKNNGYANKKITELLTKEGYNITSKVLLASDYGVPQNRRRAFFVGIKGYHGKKFNFDKIPKKKKVTVKDAISDLYDITNDDKKIIYSPKSEYQKLMRKFSNDYIYNNEIIFPNEKVQERMSYVPQGGNWRNVPEYLWDTVRSNRHSSAYRRLKEEDQSITIDTGHMNYFHPLYNRVPTVRESARIQSFPDDFIFKGNRTSQFRQVGNAVPPLLAKELALTLKNYLEG